MHNSKISFYKKVSNPHNGIQKNKWIKVIDNGKELIPDMIVISHIKFSYESDIVVIKKIPYKAIQVRGFRESNENEFVVGLEEAINVINQN